MFNVKKLVGNFLGFVLLFFLKKSALQKFDKHVMSIYFHNPSVFLFKAIVRFLVANQFRFIDENEFYKFLVGDRTLNGRRAFISFDDGCKENLKLIPVLEKYQIPVTIFVPVEPVVTGNYWWEYVDQIKKKHPEISSDEDLKKLSNKERVALVTQAKTEVDLERSAINLKELDFLNQHPLIRIGSHSYHHPIGIRCSGEELAFEYSESKQTLETWLNSRIESFSYPNGDYDERDLALLEENGYKMAFTTEPTLAENAFDIYEIPRVSINSRGGQFENISRMLGLWHQYIQPFYKQLQPENNKMQMSFKKKYSELEVQ